MRREAAVVARVRHWPARKGFFLYWAVNTVNSKIYIGATKDFMGRKADHMNDALNGSKLPFHAAIRKYGPDVFVFVPIEEFQTEAAMLEAERVAIAECHTQDREIGYNVADGGLGLGSGGAREVHSRPDYQARFKASYPGRAIKAAITRRRNQALRAAALARL